MFSWRTKRAPTLPADDVIGWEFEVFAFLFDHFGGYRHFRRRRLVTPTPDELPLRNDGSGSYPERLLARMKEMAGLLEWPCRLELSTAVADEPAGGCGRSFDFRVDPESGDGVISVPRSDDPRRLIAGIAGGLGGFVIEALASDLPGGEDLRNSTAEIGGVFLGFGLFLAADCAARMASSVHEVEDLRPTELLYAVGIFAALQSYPVKGVLRYLDRRSRAILRAVEDDVRRRWQPELDRLRSLVPSRRL
jgi:hypothetical protein